MTSLRELLGFRWLLTAVVSLVFVVAGLGILLVTSTVAASKASLSATRSLHLEVENHQLASSNAALLQRLNDDEGLLLRLVNEADSFSNQAKNNAVAASQIVADIDRTLNALCKVNRCGAPPIVLPGSSAGSRSASSSPSRPPPTPSTPSSSPGSTTTTTTLLPQVTLPIHAHANR